MLRFIWVLALMMFGCASGATGGIGDPTVATFSIVAYDRASDELGIAVASRVVAVGAVVPWAEAGVGAVATQSLANTAYGPRGLGLMRTGEPPSAVLEKLLKTDPQRELRQVGLVDAQGRTAAFTGSRCLPWAGHKSGEGYTVQGNILAGPQVLDAMAAAFEKATGDLGDRLLAALLAGEQAGGDKRGKQAAALLVVRKNGGYGGFNDRYRDLRVDDHENPVSELVRIYQIHKYVFKDPNSASPR